MDKIKVEDIFKREGARIKILPVEDEVLVTSQVFQFIASTGDNPLEFSFDNSSTYPVPDEASFDLMVTSLNNISGVVVLGDFYRPGQGNGGTDEWEINIRLTAADLPSFDIGDDVFFIYQIGGFRVDATYVSDTITATGEKFVKNQRPFHFISGAEPYSTMVTRTYITAGYSFSALSRNAEIFCCRNNDSAPDIEKLLLLPESTRHEGRVTLAYRAASLAPLIKQIAIVEYNKDGI